MTDDVKTAIEEFEKIARARDSQPNLILESDLEAARKTLYDFVTKCETAEMEELRGRLSEAVTSHKGAMEVMDGLLAGADEREAGLRAGILDLATLLGCEDEPRFKWMRLAILDRIHYAEQLDELLREACQLMPILDERATRVRMAAAALKTGAALSIPSAPPCPYGGPAVRCTMPSVCQPANKCMSLSRAFPDPEAGAADLRAEAVLGVGNQSPLHRAAYALHKAVAHLGTVKDGKTLFEGSPLGDPECFDAWTALNNAQKDVAVALLLNALPPTSTPSQENVEADRG